MKIIVFGGWYGSGNIGDDAILIGLRNILRSVKPNITITALSTNPSHTTSICGVDAIPLKSPLNFLRASKQYSDAFSSADASIMTGGTPIYDYDHISRFMHNWLSKKTGKVFLFGVGAKKITSFIGKQITSRILRDALRISVRDMTSLRTLNKLTDKEPILTGDSAFFLEPALKSQVLSNLSQYKIDLDKEFVIFCPRALSTVFKCKYHDPVTKQQIEEIRFSQAKLVKTLTQIGYQVVFMPMHVSSVDNDLKEIESIKRLMTVKIPNLPMMTPGDVATILGCASLVVGLRLHSLILAASQRVPVVTIGYDDKVRGFMEMMDLKKFVSCPDNLSKVALQALKHREDLVDVLDAHCFDMKHRIIEEAKKVSDFL